MAWNRSPKLTYSVRLKGGDQKRLRELILYIADKCERDAEFGATKLNKILYYSDFRSFMRFGQPITGAEYQRLEHGPAPLALKVVERDMRDQGEIAVRANPYGPYTQKRITVLKDADLSLFSARDIAIVDAVIDELWGKTAREVSQGSHGRAWKTHQNGDSLPYQSSYLSDDPVTPDDIERCQQLVQEIGWHVT